VIQIAMVAPQEIGELCIDAEAQISFAHLTGDYNPSTSMTRSAADQASAISSRTE
jgi:hypothetical protein